MTKEKLSPEEVEKRRQANENALANVELEGLTVSEEHKKDMELWVKGELTMEEVLQRIKERP